MVSPEYIRFKLSQSQYNLARLRGHDRLDTFEFDVSNFLASARTVLLYIDDEVSKQKTNIPAKEWRNAAFKKYRTLRFLVEERNLDIHVRPVTVARKALEIDATPITGYSQNPIGQVVTVSGPFGTYEGPPESFPATAFFPKWSGSETTEALCTTMFDELRMVVDEAFGLGLIATSKQGAS